MLLDKGTCIKSRNQNTRIVKSFYNKDASDSVTKSFLSLRTNAERQFQFNETSSISSVSSASISNNYVISDTCNQLQLQASPQECSKSHSSDSCVLFLDNLVQKQKATKNSSHYQIKSAPTNKTSFNLKALNYVTKSSRYLAKSLSLKKDNNRTKDCQSLKFNIKNKEPNDILISTSALSNSNASLTNISTLLNNNKEKVKGQLARPKKKSQEFEYTTSSSDYLDSIEAPMAFHTHHQPSLSRTPDNSNYYNQYALLSKKLRKLLPNNYGLKNHGNTCFINSVLQCLFHTSPLVDFFITDQFQQDMQVIVHQNKIAALKSGVYQHVPQFILTKHFHRLLSAMWWNTYETSYSQELKQIVASLNPTFSGGTQNDSHEFCVWLLDKLSQELSLKIPAKPNQQQPATSSFVEELFQVEFKSTVVCSTCGYRSSKYETDMMLSLPLPQNQNKPFLSTSTKSVQNRSLFISLILVNQNSIKKMLTNGDESNNQDSTSSKSKFYVPELASSIDNPSPLHVKIACNINMSEDVSYSLSAVNPSLADLRRYLSSSYYLESNHLVFINLNQVETNLTDSETIREVLCSNTETGLMNDSMCVVELQPPLLNTRIEAQLPFINVVGLNVYFDEKTGSVKQQRLVCYGLPFVLLVNRTSSYSELCRQLLEAQSKHFKDRNMLKYKDLVERLFTLSLSVGGEQVKLKSSDEMPLYTEQVEKAINENQLNNLGYIRLNIEWRSFEGISNLFKDIDYRKADFVHRSVKYIQKQDTLNENNDQQAPAPATSHFHATSVTTATLDDCFKLFTEREHLTDENSWLCPKCQKQTSAFKNLCISQVPPILIIHFKRFFYKSKTSNFKLTTPVWFPVTSLDISKYIEKTTSSESHTHEYDSSDCESSYDLVDSTLESNSEYIYDLFAVANHQGTNMANGHYTAFCKNLVDTKWYCFDDGSCTPLSDSGQPSANIFNSGSTTVWTENAYILFYKKRDCMRNERWWTSYVDRALYDHDEFDRFLHNLDHIQDQQKRNQETTQHHQLQQHRLNRNQNGNNQISAAKTKKSTGLKKIRNILSTATSSSSRKEYDLSTEQWHASDLEVNHYDENVKPNRLLKQSHSSSNSGSVSSPKPSSNIFTMNTITDLPSSDSNSSINNSTFGTPRPSTTSCFKTQVVPSEEVFKEVNNEKNKRILGESSVTNKYQPDNDVQQQQTNSLNVFEFQPRHHRPPMINNKSKINDNSSNVSNIHSTSSGSNVRGGKSPCRSSSKQHDTSSRYKNPSSFETPI